MAFIHYSQIRNSLFFRAITLIMVAVTGLACAIPGLGDDPPAAGDAGPVVTVSSPTDGQQLEPGVEIQILSTSLHAEGIVRTELLVDGEVIWVDANAQPQPDTPFIVAQPWTPDLPGSHVIQVRAFNPANVSGQSEPVVVDVVAAAQAVDDQPPPATAEPEVSPVASTPVSALGDAPTATPPPLPTPAQPADTPTPAAPKLTPTPTPTPGVFASTGLEPEGRFAEIWQAVGAGDSRLGYPTGPEIDDRDFARQYFENGLMYWWDSPAEAGYIWVVDSPQNADLTGGATWNRYPDSWDGEEEFPCEAARRNDDMGPRRGFGQLWCERPELRTRLGNPRDREAGSGGSPPFGHVQFYQGGVMLYNPINGEVFVLFDQGDWQRFGW